MTNSRRLAAACCAAIASSLAVACSPSNAPPVRTGGFGAPGRVGGKEFSAGLSPSARMFEDVTGLRFGADPSVVIGIANSFALEAGGSFAAKQQAMGFGGARLTITEKATRSRLAVDFGFGGGAGVGGARCGNKKAPVEDEEDDFLDLTPDCRGGGEDGTDVWDEIPWHDRAAYGGYVDIGFAWRLERTKPIFFLLRPRVQVSAADGVPLTVWYELAYGPQFKFHKIDFHAAIVPTIYHNDWQTHVLLGLELGFHFSTQ